MMAPRKILAIFRIAERQAVRGQIKNHGPWDSHPPILLNKVRIHAGSHLFQVELSDPLFHSRANRIVRILAKDLRLQRSPQIRRYRCKPVAAVTQQLERQRVSAVGLTHPRYSTVRSKPKR